eukprot:g11847.t1
MISDVDDDGSGTIGYEEFLKMMTHKILNRDPKDEILKAFRLFDDDETGKISFKNLKRVAKELGERMTDEERHTRGDELQEMIDEADRDGDGEVNEEECLRTPAGPPPKDPHAGQAGQLAVARTLLEHGASMNLPSTRGRTPLMVAVEAQQPELVKLLVLSGADLEKSLPGHWTPLHLACLIPENLGFEGGFQWFRSLKRCFVCAWNWVTWSFAYLEPRKAPSPCPAGGQARAGLPWGDSEFFTDLFSTVVGSSAVSWLTEHPASGSP